MSEGLDFSPGEGTSFDEEEVGELESEEIEDAPSPDSSLRFSSWTVDGPFPEGAQFASVDLHGRVGLPAIAFKEGEQQLIVRFDAFTPRLVSDSEITEIRFITADRWRTLLASFNRRRDTKRFDVGTADYWAYIRLLDRFYDWDDGGVAVGLDLNEEFVVDRLAAMLVHSHENSPGYVEQYEPEVARIFPDLFARVIAIRAEKEVEQRAAEGQLLQAGFEEGGRFLESGARSFPDFIRHMARVFGWAIQPHLQTIYIAMRRAPGLDRSQFDTASNVDELPRHEISAIMSPEIQWRLDQQPPGGDAPRGG